MADEDVICTARECDQPARCAIKIARPTRGNMYLTIYYDERTAPKTAKPYCKKHGVETVTDVSKTLIDEG